MSEHAGDERARISGEQVRCFRVVEAIPVRIGVPEREVNVAAVARVVRPGLRREGRDEPMARSNSADRLAHEDLLVGSA